VWHELTCTDTGSTVRHLIILLLLLLLLRLLLLLLWLHVVWSTPGWIQEKHMLPLQLAGKSHCVTTDNTYTLLLLLLTKRLLLWLLLLIVRKNAQVRHMQRIKTQPTTPLRCCQLLLLIWASAAHNCTTTTKAAAAAAAAAATAVRMVSACEHAHVVHQVFCPVRVQLHCSDPPELLQEGSNIAASTRCQISD
jgi:hypothetical protein